MHLPPPRRDRVEIIQLAGYTEDEKVQIAKRYLVPRQLEQNGLTKEKLVFEEESLRELIDVTAETPGSGSAKQQHTQRVRFRHDGTPATGSRCASRDRAADR